MANGFVMTLYKKSEIAFLIGITLYKWPQNRQCVKFDSNEAFSYFYSIFSNSFQQQNPFLFSGLLGSIFIAAEIAAASSFRLDLNNSFPIS